ncbi:MAG: small multi-drug export protein, partial [Patescibacteria group bacterium]
AIVAGVTVLSLNPWLAFVLATSGNIIVSIAIYYLLGPTTDFLRKHIVWIDKLCSWVFQRTRDKHSKRMSEVGHFLLFLYLAIPTPGSGGWSGALIAHVFGVPARAFLPLAIFGLISAGLLVTFGAEIVLFIFGGSPA